MRCLYIVAPVLLCAAILAMQIHLLGRHERFGVNAGYYLSGDGQWAGQMQPAAASTDGATGLVPAPLTGQQNSYLRGDGKWIQAGNVPTAAQYYYASLTSRPAANTPMGFNTITMSAGTAITTSNGSSFALAVGYTYKITVCVNYNTGAGGYPNDYTIVRLYNNDTEFGTPGYGLIGVASNSPIIACGYVIPTVTANITVKANYACILLPGFINIEVVSNNNTILPFSGATSAADGFIGYIPTPKAGQQNYYLSGGGSWTKLGLGMTGETWRDVTSSRPKNALQTNNFTYPIAINVAIGNSSGGRYASLWVGPTKVAYNEGGNTSTFYAVVPPGQTYQIYGGDSVNVWSELY